jgi:hypothetical protein
MQDEQNTTADQDPRQLIRDVTDTLGAIVGALRQGNSVPRELVERGEQVWAALDQHPMEDSGPQVLLMEGEGNLERTILYRLEHGEPVEAATLDAAETWIQEARQQSGG